MSSAAMREIVPHSALRSALSNGDAGSVLVERPTSSLGAEYPIWRLLSAWAARGTRDFGPDEIVLLRQFLRWTGGTLASGELNSDVASSIDTFGPRAGVRRGPGELRAKPFEAAWLTGEPVAAELDALPESRRPTENIPAEPFLTGALRYSEWKSLAQKEGVWRTLTAPARSTTLIALPTGAGKSLCFQAAAQFSSGLTVVVVPTIALAIDHWRSAQRALVDAESVGVRYYASDDPSSSAEDVIDAVERRRCRLLITSPEACVSGRLRPVLADAARSGWLHTLVVDEAHLVDTWGMYFRVDFQVLAALRRQWLEEPSAQLRTILLSATFTPGCRRMLRHLFAEANGSWQEVASQRLRPEMTYFLRGFRSEAERERAVIDCLWQLPRPMILYTTTREDARRWETTARCEGFRRIGCFHGETPAAQRRQLLDAWRSDQIDLMVATSAFGMGVDKPDVRSVVHACLPEDLHRYYQEVGRGGRDGGSATCVLLPFLPKDEEIAEGLAPRLLKPDTLQRRWAAMWKTAERAGADPQVWRIRTNARPPNLFGEFTGQRNVTWNKRLLLQLARAGLLDVIDVRKPRSGAAPEEPGSSGQGEADVDFDVVADAVPDEAVVRLHFAPHSADVGLQIEAMRQDELDSLRRGLDYMREYMAGNECIGRALRRMYGPDTVYTCGGCPSCRRLGRRHQCPRLPVPAASGGTHARRQIVAGVPSLVRSEQALAFAAFLRRVAQAGYRRFACESDIYGAVVAAVGNGWPPGAGLIYRVDALNAVSRLSVSDTESVVVIHAGRLSEVGLRVNQGRRVLHLITLGTPYIDANGRRPLELDGVTYFPSPDLWAPET